MNAIEMLTHQHRQIETALRSLVDSQGDARVALFSKAADELTAHIMVEEEHFYPAVNSKRTKDTLLESLEEHLSLKRVLADLVALPVMDEHFEPKLHVLKEQLEHHHKEEEEELFPEAQELLTAAEIEALGTLMSAAEKRLLAREPRDMVADQTDAARALP